MNGQAIDHFVGYLRPALVTVHAGGVGSYMGRKQQAPDFQRPGIVLTKWKKADLKLLVSILLSPLELLQAHSEMKF